MVVLSVVVLASVICYCAHHSPPSYSNNKSKSKHVRGEKKQQQIQQH